MKWNWGTKLTIAITLWISFILFMVFRMVQQDVPLVEDDYYPQAVAYQDKIDKKINAAHLEHQVKITQMGDSLEFSFPIELIENEISGQIWIYRPSGDDNGDYKFNISTNDFGKQVFVESHLLTGKYVAKIDYKAGEKAYYQESTIYIK